MSTQFILPALGLLLTIVFGFWLSRLGQPYNGALFNLHKLVALGVVVLLALRFARLPFPGPSAWLVATCLCAALLSVVVLFASGALMSAGKASYSLLLLVHRIAPLVLVAALALAIYLAGRAV